MKSKLADNFRFIAYNTESVLDKIEGMAVLAVQPCANSLFLDRKLIFSDFIKQYLPECGVINGGIQNQVCQGIKCFHGCADLLTLRLVIVVNIFLGVIVNFVDQLVVHVHQVIHGVTVKLAEKTDDHRAAMIRLQR